MVTALASDPSPYWTYEGLAIVGVLGALVVLLVGLALRRGLPKNEKITNGAERLLRRPAAAVAVVSLVAATLAITRGISGVAVLTLVTVGSGALIVIGLVGSGLAIGRVLAVIQGAIWLVLLAPSGLGFLLGPVAWGAAAAARLRPLLAVLLLGLPSMALAAANVVEAMRPTDLSQVVLAAALSVPGLVAASFIGLLGGRRAT